MCCRRFAGRPERCSGTIQTVHRAAEFRKEGKNSNAGPIRAPQLHKSSVVPVVSLCAHGVGRGKIATCISGLSGTSWLFGHTVHTKPFTLWPSDRANDSNCNTSLLFRAKSDCLDCSNFALYWTMAIERAPIRKVKPAGTYLNLAMLVRVNSNSRSKSVWIVSLGVWDAALLIILPWSTASTPSSTDLFVTVAQDCGRSFKDSHRQIRCEAKLQHCHWSWNEIHLQQSAWLSIHQDHITLPQTSCWYLHNRNANLTQHWKNKGFYIHLDFPIYCKIKENIHMSCASSRQSAGELVARTMRWSGVTCNFAPPAAYKMTVARAWCCSGGLLTVRMEPSNPSTLDPFTNCLLLTKLPSGALKTESVMKHGQPKVSTEMPEVELSQLSGIDAISLRTWIHEASESTSAASVLGAEPLRGSFFSSWWCCWVSSAKRIASTSSTSDLIHVHHEINSRKRCDTWASFVRSDALRGRLPAFSHKSCRKVFPQGIRGVRQSGYNTHSAPPHIFARPKPCQVTLPQTHKLAIRVRKYAAAKRRSSIRPSASSFFQFLCSALQPKRCRLDHVHKHEIQVPHSTAPTAWTMTISSAPPFPPCLWTQKRTHHSSLFPVSATCAPHPAVKACYIFCLCSQTFHTNALLLGFESAPSQRSSSSSAIGCKGEVLDNRVFV